MDGHIRVFYCLSGFALSSLSFASTGQLSVTPPNPQQLPRDVPPVATNSTKCQIYPTTMESWYQLGVDEFLHNFPGGSDMPLDDFVFANHISNFPCGLGENCLAGQQCLPFEGPLWFTLYSLQEWNLYVNSLYDATTAAVTQIKEMSTSMITDFLVSPNLKERQVTQLAVLIVSVVASALTSITVGLFGPVFFPAWGLATAADLADEAAGLAEVVQGGTRFAKRSLRKRSVENVDTYSLDSISQSQRSLSQILQRVSAAKDQVQNQQQFKIIHDPGFETSAKVQTTLLTELRKARGYLIDESSWAKMMTCALTGDEEGLRKIRVDISNDLPQDQSHERRLAKRSAAEDIPPDHFATWNVINSYLTSFCDHLKSVVAITSQIGITAPISSDEGIWGIIQKGRFLTPNRDKSFLQDTIRDSMRLSALAQVLKAMNMFVTIGSDKCDGKGPNGAWEGKDKLSYCSPEGLMMNLIRASKNKSINKIVNAHLISEKYGYTVEFLAQSAWSCQEHNLKIAGRPSPVGLKSNSTVGCTFDLAVCDTRIPEVSKLLKKHKSTVVACRKGLALNI